MTSYKRILVIRLGAFGDIIRSFGAMEALRRHHVDAHLTLLTTPPFAAMMEKSPYFDRVWPIRRWPWMAAGEWISFVRRLRVEKYDAVYDLQRNDRTRILSWLAPAALRKKWFGGQKMPSGEAALEIIDIPKFPLPDMSWMEVDISSFAIKKPFVLLVPGCSPQHPEKRWPAARYADLARELDRHGYTPVVLGTTAEADIIRELALAAPMAHDLCGKTSFMDIAALARQAAGAIGNDTGPMHLISIAGCPCVSLFSGTSSAANSTPQGKNVTLLQKQRIEDITVAEALAAFLNRKR